MTDLSTLAAELQAVRDDLALYEGLSTAADKVAALSSQYERAKAAHDREEATRVKAANEARFAGLGDIRVDVVPDKEGGGVLRMGFNIHYTRAAYDMYAKASIPQPRTVGGFAALPTDVLAYLIEKHPERVPAEIMALSPGNPRAAFATYFSGLKRGYLAGKVRA
jgi:hypothetical protein